MSRSKNRKDDQIHELRKIIKDRDDEIRRLHRKLNNELKAEKKAKNYEPKKKEEKPKENNCPECVDGKLKTIDLGPRNLTSCNSCNYRKATKK